MSHTHYKVAAVLPTTIYGGPKKSSRPLYVAVGRTAFNPEEGLRLRVGVRF